MSGKPLPPPLVRPKSPPVDPSAGRTPPVPVRGWFPMFMVGDEARVAHAVPLKTWPALCGDSGLEFLSGHQLDRESAGQVPANMIGRLLDDGDLRKLHQMLIKKKPPAPSVRRRTAIKRRVGKS
jgi:hypothetical protein